MIRELSRSGEEQSRAETGDDSHGNYPLALMANSRYAYVRDFELPDRLLPGTFILFRIDGHAFRQFSSLFLPLLYLRAHPNHVDSLKPTVLPSPTIAAALSLWIMLRSPS